MKIEYVSKKFSAATLDVVERANEIIAEYLAGGYQLTLRQLYYQFVSRDLLPNTQQSYSRLGSIINDARLAGWVDWEAIEDRTRDVKIPPHWNGPAGIIRAAAESYAIDKWEGGPCRCEIWVEKEALAGVFDRVCKELDVPFLACRGYVSASEMWRAAMRLKKWERAGYTTTVFHFGDHDPSGIDMTRDIQDRLALFGARTGVRRMALSMAQVEQYSPPPNPAKVTDSRFAGYQAEYGDESWELDALEPRVLVDLVRSAVTSIRDDSVWERLLARQEEDRQRLSDTAEEWEADEEERDDE